MNVCTVCTYDADPENTLFLRPEISKTALLRRKTLENGGMIGKSAVSTEKRRRAKSAHTGLCPVYGSRAAIVLSGCHALKAFAGTVGALPHMKNPAFYMRFLFSAPASRGTVYASNVCVSWQMRAFRLGHRTCKAWSGV